MWQPQLESFEDRARCLAPDLPGFGLSPPGEPTPTLEQWARHVLERLDDLAVDRFVAVGASMGGQLALRVAALAPQRVLGLLLAGARADADSAERRDSRHRLAAEVEREGIDAAADEILPTLLARSTLQAHPERLDELRRMARENTPSGVAAALRALAEREDLSWRLPAIACPVICVVGEEDEVTPPETVHAMGAKLAQSTTVVVPDAGHLPNLEAPPEFDRALDGLLRRVSP